MKITKTRNLTNTWKSTTDQLCIFFIVQLQKFDKTLKSSFRCATFQKSGSTKILIQGTTFKPEQNFAFLISLIHLLFDIYFNMCYITQNTNYANIDYVFGYLNNVQILSMCHVILVGIFSKLLELSKKSVYLYVKLQLGSNGKIWNY